MGIETKYAKSDAVNIAYQVIGDGPIDLVFVMGWISNLDYFWEEPHFARFLRRLGSFSRLILFDKRGTGLSDRAVGIPTLEQRMDDVRAVMDAVGSKQAALLGVSEAGALCTLFAATYPQRTSALVLLGCVPRRLWAPDYPWGATPGDRLQRLQQLEQGWGTVEFAAADLERRAPSVAHDTWVTQWWATYLRMSASPGGAAAVLRMNNDIDVRAVLPSIRVPTLIIQRAEDRTVNVEMSRYMAAKVPGARYVELPGEDHLPFFGDQDAILSQVEEFLTGVPCESESNRALLTLLVSEVVDTRGVSDAAPARGEWRDRVAAYDAMAREEVTRFRGRHVQTDGGRFLASFDGPARAIRCSLAMADAARALGLDIRGGVHAGECDLAGGSLSGLTVQAAERVMASAAPGEMLVSTMVRDLVAGSNLRFEEMDAGSPGGTPGDPRLCRVCAESDSSTVSQPSPRRAASRTSSRELSLLTRRERQVAVLVGRGLTNRQISHELTIAESTAERHVINILNKLGQHSRVQIATWATGQGLVDTTAD